MSAFVLFADTPPERRFGLQLFSSNYQIESEFR